MRGSAQNLDHDGLLGGAEGLHRLVVGGLGEVLAIDLEEGERISSATFLKEGNHKDAKNLSLFLHLVL